MKKSLILTSLLTLSTSLIAMEYKYFFAVGMENQNASFSGNSVANDVKATELKLKTGIFLNKTNRISLSHIKFGEDQADFTVSIINYDRLIPVNHEYKLYAGFHVGNAKYEEPNLDIDGLAYGAQLGIVFINETNMELEFGLAYSKYDFDDTINGSEAEVKAISIFTSINYKF